MDLGTNTFHLLIAEPDTDTFFKQIQHDHVGVKLGEGGINEGTIKAEAYRRGIDTLIAFQRSIEQHGVSKMKAIGTSAMRSASNGDQFMDEVRERTGIQIETISGETEAGYIYQGVKASGCLTDSKSLIVDIGGGSVEFILCTQEEILYKQSFEIGAARLMSKFHRTDPITREQVTEMHTYLDQMLAPLFDVVNGHDLQRIIGSSGAFETFAELAEAQNGRVFDLKLTPTYTFDLADLNTVTEHLIHSDHEQRAATKSIIEVRVDMIVVASLLTRYLISKLGVNEVSMTAYSLKEGVLAELFGK